MQKLLIDMHCGGLTPASSWTPIQLFDFLLQLDGEREEQKQEKLVGEDKDSLKTKENQNLIKNPQWSKGNYSPPLPGSPAVQPVLQQRLPWEIYLLPTLLLSMMLQGME